jgi:2-polyprenyl-3-methyl-5-hydroxy-6-metoxy-1,4-benzoquinol methylase
MQPMPCIACGEATRHRFLFKVNQCDIWRCEGCGLGHADARNFDPESYYTADYFSGRHSDGYADYRGAEPVLRREFARSVEFVRRFRREGRLIDVGCAYGFFLKEAERHFSVAGIEIAEDAAQACRDTGLTVLSGAADQANLARLGEADVITLFDVIEHLPQPHETLALCHRHLKPGGVLVITTGDFASLAARWAGARWRLMTPPQHLWFFTAESLRRMAPSLGYAVEHIDHPGKIVPLSLIVFQLRRMLGANRAATTLASGVGIPVNLFDAMRVVLRRRP